MKSGVGSHVETASPGNGGAVVIREVALPASAPLYAQPDWHSRFPWLFQATTGAGTHGDFDLSFFGHSQAGAVFERWRTVQAETGFESVMHARQVHGARILVHDHRDVGIVVRNDADGHMTATPGLLLAVSIADCVPVFVVDADRQAIAIMHAGWRGIAGGVLESGIQALQRDGGSARSLFVHFGPAICGRCYEVGPEVHEALGLPRPAGNTPVNLYAVLAMRAANSGIPQTQISASTFCTRCDGETFFSHRAGRRERQMGLLGIRNRA